MPSFRGWLWLMMPSMGFPFSWITAVGYLNDISHLHRRSRWSRTISRYIEFPFYKAFYGYLASKLKPHSLCIASRPDFSSSLRLCYVGRRADVTNYLLEFKMNQRLPPCHIFWRYIYRKSFDSTCVCFGNVQRCVYISSVCFASESHSSEGSKLICTLWAPIILYVVHVLSNSLIHLNVRHFLFAVKYPARLNVSWRTLFDKLMKVNNQKKMIGAFCVGSSGLPFFLSFYPFFFLFSDFNRSLDERSHFDIILFVFFFFFSKRKKRKWIINNNNLSFIFYGVVFLLPLFSAIFFFSSASFPSALVQRVPLFSTRRSLKAPFSLHVSFYSTFS